MFFIEQCIDVFALCESVIILVGGCSHPIIIILESLHTWLVFIQRNNEKKTLCRLFPTTRMNMK